MERQTNPSLFGVEPGTKVLVQETMNAGGRMGGFEEGDIVTPRQLVKATFTEALHRLGGTDWLVDFARRNDGNARVMVQVFSKLIPLELVGKGGAPLTVYIRKEDGEGI